MFLELIPDSVVDVNAEVQLPDPVVEDAVLQCKWIDVQEISEKCETALRNTYQCRTVRFIPTGDNSRTVCLVE